MEGESGEQVGGELESVTSSAGWFMQSPSDNNIASWNTNIAWHVTHSAELRLSVNRAHSVCVSYQHLTSDQWHVYV